MHPLRRKVAFVLPWCAAMLAGCGSAGGSDAMSPSTSVATRTVSKAAGAQQQVTGAVFITVPTLPESAERFTFSAVRHQDGHVSGRFELSTEQNTGARFSGVVTCLAIDGATARLGAITTKASGANVSVGDRWIWTVVDRGEGMAAPPDLVSDFLFAFPGEPEEFCAGNFNPDLPLVGNARGNIQIQL